MQNWTSSDPYVGITEEHLRASCERYASVTTFDLTGAQVQINPFWIDSLGVT